MSNGTATSRWNVEAAKVANQAPRKGAGNSTVISKTDEGDMVQIGFTGLGQTQIRVLWHFLSRGPKHLTTADLYAALPNLAASSIRGALIQLHRYGALRRIAPKRRSPYSPVRFVLNAAYQLPPGVTGWGCKLDD